MRREREKAATGGRGSQRKAGSKNSNGSNKRAKPSLDLAWKKTTRRDRQRDDGDDDAADGDEHIDSSSDDDDDNVKGSGRRTKDPPSLDEESDDDEKEPLETKRVRLARQYLEKIDGRGAESSSSAASSDEDGDDHDNDRLGRRLQRERQKKEGTLERILADKVARQMKSRRQQDLTDRDDQPSILGFLQGHDLTPTCVALTGNGTRAVSGSKDHSVMLWDIEKETKLTNILPHWKKSKDNDHKNYRTLGQVLSVACSDDEHYAAVGKRDATVSIFDLRAKSGCNLVHTFEGHKAAVTCLAFRSQSLELFSGSDDRCIRHYNLAEMLYLETLYGHQFGVTAIDCLRKERPVSVGQDRTARAWKLELDTHLIFRGGSKIQPADCVSLIKDDWFLTGHQDGHLSLWMTDKKKPVVTVETAHGVDHASGGLGRTVTSVGCLPGSDLAASGSTDGYLRFWKVRTGKTLDKRGLDALFEIPLEGYINAIAFGPKAKFCVSAVGQEHRLGRWNRIPGAKNRLAIVKLYYDDDEGEHPSSADNADRSEPPDLKEHKSSASEDDNDDNEATESE